VPLNGSNDESMIPEGPIHDVYQEDGLEGTFVIDLGAALDSITSSLGSDEVTDPKDLEAIENRVEDEEYDEEAIYEEGDCPEEGEDEPMDEEEEETYDPHDF